MYSYETEKSKLFSDEGQRKFVKFRDCALDLIKKAGAARMDAMMRESRLTGDSWFELACADRMVELGDIVEIIPQRGVMMGQYRIFTKYEGM